jgi:hypothetical protein
MEKNHYSIKMSAPAPAPNVLQVRTKTQQLLMDISTTVNGALNVDYSTTELLGNSVINLVAGKFAPIVPKIVYGFTTLLNTLSTVDENLPNNPLFGGPDALPYGTTEADLQNINSANPNSVHAGAFNHLVPRLSQAQTDSLLTGSDQKIRLARAAHSLARLKNSIAHARKVKERAKVSGVPISNLTTLQVSDNVAALLGLPGAKKVVAREVEIAPQPAPAPAPAPLYIPVYLPAPAPAQHFQQPQQYQPIIPVPAVQDKQQELMAIAMQRVRW